jgi:hypothetical protein
MRRDARQHNAPARLDTGPAFFWPWVAVALTSSSQAEFGVSCGVKVPMGVGASVNLCRIAWPVAFLPGKPRRSRPIRWVARKRAPTALGFHGWSGSACGRCAGSAKASRQQRQRPAATAHSWRYLRNLPESFATQPRPALRLRRAIATVGGTSPIIAPMLIQIPSRRVSPRRSNLGKVPAYFKP